jgi:large subunit ribosomal protein L15
MKVHELNVSSHTRKSRVGRGIAAGQGKTAGRGTKGQGSRAGNDRRPGFEGGQNPLMQRLPKLRGFKSHRPKAETIYTGQLELVKGVVDNFSLFEAGLVMSPYSTVKLIQRGEVTKKFTVKLQGSSASATEAIKKAGGSFDITPRVKREAKKTADQ